MRGVCTETHLFKDAFPDYNVMLGFLHNRQHLLMYPMKVQSKFVGVYVKVR